MNVIVHRLSHGVDIASQCNSSDKSWKSIEVLFTNYKHCIGASPIAYGSKYILDYM